MSKSGQSVIKREESGEIVYNDLSNQYDKIFHLTDKWFNQLDSDHAEIRRQLGVLDHQREIDKGER